MKLILSAVLLSIVAASPALANPKHWHDDEKHWKKDRRGHDDDDRFDGHDVDCRFPPREVRIIREYYEPRYRSLPPGLAKKYYRTGHLPPGWQKKMAPLPVIVERRLAPLPRGYRRGYIDGAIVVYSPHSEIVLDVVTPFRP